MSTPTTTKKYIALICLFCSILIFQNCGGEGFISAQGVSEFDSFEDAYPEMNEEGQIEAKFEKSRGFFNISPAAEQEYDRIFRAVPARPSTSNGGGLGENGGINGTPGSGSSGSSGFGSGDVDQSSPTFIGSDRDYYEDEFNLSIVVEKASDIKKYQSSIFPTRYYSAPDYVQAFGGNGLGIISVSEELGTANKKTPAVFYQYKLDYFREKAVVFVLTDGLSRGKLGASTVTVNQNEMVKLAKLGYLVVHLKPGDMRSAVLAEDKCENLGQFFFNGVQEVRRAISSVVSRANYYGVDKDKMFIIGFGEGGTLAAEVAFLDSSEARSRYGEELVEVPGLNGQSLFKGVAVSGGGVIDRAIIQGSSKARVVTVHGGNDPKVSILGDSIYSCEKNSAHKINPMASVYFSQEVSARAGASASVLHCGESKPADVKPLSTQFGYFATYFHNIMISSGFGISNYYRSKYCDRDDGEYKNCKYPVPLINQLVSLTVGQAVGNFYTKGPCAPQLPPGASD